PSPVASSPVGRQRANVGLRALDCRSSRKRLVPGFLPVMGRARGDGVLPREEGEMVSCLAPSALAPWGVLLLTAGAWGQQAPQEPGTAVRRNGVAVFAAVEGRTAVVFVPPRGARVKKGDLVCELDPTGVKERLANQELILAGSAAGLRGARLAREAA